MNIKEGQVYVSKNKIKILKVEKSDGKIINIIAQPLNYVSYSFDISEYELDKLYNLSYPTPEEYFES